LIQSLVKKVRSGLKHRPEKALEWAKGKAREVLQVLMWGRRKWDRGGLTRSWNPMIAWKNIFVLSVWSGDAKTKNKTEKKMGNLVVTDQLLIILGQSLQWCLHTVRTISNQFIVSVYTVFKIIRKQIILLSEISY
jgi:hypothetical protein